MNSIPVAMAIDSSPTLCRLPDTVWLYDCPFTPITEQQLVDHIVSALDHRCGGWVVTANLDHLRRAAADPDYHTLMRQADIVVADGMPLVWASRLQGTPLPERVAGSSLVCSLAAALPAHQHALFLLGGDPGTADQAANVLTRRCPGLQIAGTHCPLPGFERDTQQLQALIDALLCAQPQVVYMALGSPKQEKLIRQLRPYLPDTWWIGVGISFSFLAGRVRRAPRWVQQAGLEWVHRLAQEPRRLARRYLLHGLPFAAALFAHSTKQRLIGPRPSPYLRKDR